MSGGATKVIIATLMRPQGDAGVQTHFNAVYDYLRRQAVPVSLATPFSAPKALIYPLFAPRRLIDRVSGAASVWWYEYWHYRVLQRVLRRELASGPAVVYAQCPLSARAALQARIRGQHRVVMVVHFNVSQADEWMAKRKLKHHGVLYQHIQQRENDILPRLDGIIFPSEFMQAQLSHRVPEVGRVRSAVIPHFLKEDPHTLTVPHARDLINLGSLEPRKNQQYLLHVLAAANRLETRYTLTLVGDGPDRDRLKSLATELGVLPQVEFVGRILGGAKLLSSHRAYCHGAVMDNLPLALIEALSYGRPILAAPVGGIPEIFRDGIEGYYWNLQDPNEGAAKLTQLLETSTLRTMSRAARARFQATFAESAIGARFAQFLLDDAHG